MPTRDEIDDYREFERNHPGKWWEHFRRLRRFIDNRSVAIAYCEAGFEIIPLSPFDKSPSIPSPHESGSPERGVCKGECGQKGHGFHDASSDVAWADEHWTARPYDGIGIRPWVGGGVFDIDARHGGIEALAALEREHGQLPETATVMSGRGDGGHHRWFDNVPGPLRKQLCPGVDILCRERNFVVVPPSRHRINDQPYTFKNPAADIVDAPAWLVELATRPEPPPRPPRPRWPRGWRLSAAQTLRRCRGLVDTVTNAVEGERRNVLFWAACRAAEDGLLIEEDDPVWTELAEAADTTGLDRDEIHQALRGAIAIADTPQCPRSGLRSTEGPVRLRETGPVRLRGTVRRSTS